MFRVFLVVLAQALAADAAAESAKFIDGVWQGKGTFQMGDTIVLCRDITMKFSGDDKTFVVREAAMTCDGMDPQNFTEVDTFALGDNGELTFQKGVASQIPAGAKVGKVKGNRLAMLNPIDAAKVDDIDIRLAGDTLVYSQIAGAPGDRPDYALLAFMKKK
ncbi:hypothetical protein GJ654_01100 [Rhodoblastus acidophilus]|uniref:Uncharacterized protein n=1 Tax=Rhodoblastus acidophilus TaxID=1074 RepID=A0A6N8DK79_RHOAC|nr:hypothetical protein [Rhodoblastus acidophilus]MCW2272672.1 hypothetical protein [Rhodoblastus acidophilus]MTV29583.1 hypothetical protein [Rhodoblastus acidophilus]